MGKRIRAMHPGGVPAEVVEARAGKLGASLPECRNLTAGARARGTARSAAARRAGAVDAYSDLAPLMRELRAAGLTLRAIAGRLDREGHTTRTGRPWNPVQVGRVLGRLGA